MQTQELFIGIDVSKAQLDGAGLPGDLAFQQPNDPQGIAAIVSLLKTRQPTLIVLEATGGFEFPLAAALSTAGLPVAVVNPVVAFAGLSSAQPNSTCPRMRDPAATVIDPAFTSPTMTPPSKTSTRLADSILPCSSPPTTTMPARTCPVR